MKSKFAFASAMLMLAAVISPADAASISGHGRPAVGGKAELVGSAQIKKSIVIDRQRETIARPTPRNLEGLKRKIRR